jgi:hypothetical protein
MKRIFSTILAFAAISMLWAGNPDRQGEAGAYELLINPWARSAGLHTMGTASIRGAEAIQLNPAGISRITQTEIAFGHTQYLVGTGIGINALGFATKISKGGTLGIAINLMDFGEITRTTVENPEGNIGTFKPNFTNIGVSYGYMFGNKISVGATIRLVNESLTSVSARATALDAGIQYVTGDKMHDDRFKFGISLRNVGTKMVFRGEGLTIPRPNPDGTFRYDIAYYQRGAQYELPSQLNIGMAYDFYLGGSSEDFAHKLTILGNFVSNAFSRDNLGAGLEYNLGERFALRAGYKYEIGLSTSDVEATVDSGIAAGASISAPFKKRSKSNISVDYSWRSTNRWSGIHNLAVRINLGGKEKED